VPVIDASVLISLYRADDVNFHAADSWAVGSVGRHETWHLPALVLPEVAAGLTRGYPSFDGMAAVAVFEKMSSVVIHAVDADLARRAARIASAQHIRGCDAVYVALAAELGEMLVTFDRQQSLRAGDVVRVFVPE
jgi:predicted nucleic acid-binding protein